VKRRKRSFLLLVYPSGCVLIGSQAHPLSQWTIFFAERKEKTNVSGLRIITRLVFITEKKMDRKSVEFKMNQFWFFLSLSGTGRSIYAGIIKDTHSPSQSTMIFLGMHLAFAHFLFLSLFLYLSETISLCH
jgi:hypothetical protein